MKRLLDIILAGSGLLIFAPFGLVISLVLRMSGEGEVFYRQTRIGKGGKSFGLLKFATMLKNSPNIGSGNITVGNDPRVLPIGRFLRKSKLNEVPQLWNILIGDMSVVGPRPLTKDTYEMIPETIRDQIKDLTPGLTGAGSLIFRDEERYIAERPNDFREFYKEEIAPFKGKLEVWYKERKSLTLDMKIIFLTGWSVFFPMSNLANNWLKGLPKHEIFNR